MLNTILKSSGKEHEIIFLKDQKFNSCIACKHCHKRPYECCFNDEMKKVHIKLEKTKVIILGSPTYFDNVSGYMKNFIDRCLPFYFSRKLEGKKAVIVSVGSEGSKSISHSVNAMQRFCKRIGLDVISSIYATKSNPKSKKKALIRIGKLISAL